MLVPIRHARRADVAALIAIAEEGDAPGVDEGYLAFVAAQGRLLVACEGDDDRAVLGFAGGVPVGEAVMVTDLFVATARRGTGVGGALLAAVTDGFEHRMTCSSAHPAALPAYERAGLEPQWRVLVLQGRAVGGGPELPRGEWQHDRAELVAHLATTGADVGPHHVLHRATEAGAPHQVLRMMSEQLDRDADRLLAALPTGDVVEWCVPEPSPMVAVLRQRGFEVVDHDLFCASPGVQPPPELVALHRGLL